MPRRLSAPNVLVRCAALAVFALLVTTHPAAAATSVVASGLNGPSKMAPAPGGVVVAESGGATVNSGAVSWIGKNGVVRRLLTGLPAGPFETTMSGPSAVLVEGDSTLLVLIGIGNATVPGTIPGTQVANSTGGASPIFAAILEFRFRRSLDRVDAPFNLSLGDHIALSLGVPVNLTNASGDRVQASLLTNLPDFLPRSAQGGVRNANPFSLTLAGKTLYVADAGQDGVWRIDRSTGRARIAALFSPVRNPLPFGPPVSDFVPTSVRVVGKDVLLVSYLTGFPFATGNAGVRRIGGSGGSNTAFLEHLTTVTDFLPVQRNGGSTDYFVLEFSNNFLGSPQGPGRLLRFASPGSAAQVLAADLISPAGIVLDPAGGAMWVSEVFTGRIVRVPLD